MSGAGSIMQSPPVKAMTARDPHPRRVGLLVGILYTDPARGITGEAWQYPCHGDAPPHAIMFADGRVVSYRDSIHKLRLSTAPERRRLIAGEAVAVDLTAWRIEGMAGFVADVMDGLGARAIPAALVDQTRREIHLLIPSDSTARRWIDSGLIENAEPMDPRELCPAMAGVWQRANPPKKSGAKANR